MSVNNFREKINGFVILIKNFFSSRSDEFLEQRFYIKFFILMLMLFGLVFFSVYAFLMKAESRVQVPSLAALDVLEAASQLQTRGLSPVLISRFSADIPRYQVMEQNPEPGQIVKKSRKISLVVSLGRKIDNMPDFTGLTFFEAKNRILKLFTGFEKPPVIIETREYSS
ncbi:MAG TPA: hypothetical protein DC049_18685, partial [Spirochaetia bacterium]|nr:hypothetical protein [Spirochaetia bacterium]